LNFSFALSRIVIYCIFVIMWMLGRCNRVQNWTSCIPPQLLPLSRFYHFPAPTFRANKRTNGCSRRCAQKCISVLGTCYVLRSRHFFALKKIKPVPLSRGFLFCMSVVDQIFSVISSKSAGWMTDPISILYTYTLLCDTDILLSDKLDIIESICDVKICL